MYGSDNSTDWTEGYSDGLGAEKKKFRKLIVY